VRPCKIGPEAGPHVVHDQDDALLLAEGLDLLPESFGRHLVVKDNGVVIRGGDDAGDLTVVLFDGPFYLRIVIPGELDDVLRVFLDRSSAAGGLHPRGGAVVTAFEDDDLLPACRRPRHHDGQVGGVGTVLGKEGPVGDGHHIHQFLGQIDHHGRRERDRVALHMLLPGRFFHGRVVVPEDHRAIGAHVVHVLVPIHVPEPRSLGLEEVDRISRGGGGPAVVTGDTPLRTERSARHDLFRPIEQFL